MSGKSEYSFRESMFFVVYNFYFFKARIGSFEPVICASCDCKMGTAFEDKSRSPIYFCAL